MSYNNFQNGKKWKGKASLCIYTNTWILLSVSQADRAEIRQGTLLQSSVTWGTKSKSLAFCYMPLCGLRSWQTFGGKYGHEEAHTTLLLHRTQCLIATSSARLKRWEEATTLPTKQEKGDSREGRYREQGQLCRLCAGQMTVLPKLIDPA